MDQKSQQKVMNAGFCIIRRDDKPQPRIKFKSKANPEWKTLKNFETKAARDRAVVVLLNDKTTIED